MPKRKRITRSFRETQSERSATLAYANFRKQIVKMYQRLKGKKQYES